MESLFSALIHAAVAVMDLLYAILPDAFLRLYINTTEFADYLPFINWLVPFYALIPITELWIAGVIAYLSYDVIRDKLLSLVQ